MLFFYKNAINSPSAMISLTGHTKSEFDSLLPAFEKAEDDYLDNVILKRGSSFYKIL